MSRRRQSCSCAVERATKTITDSHRRDKSRFGSLYIFYPEVDGCFRRAAHVTSAARTLHPEQNEKKKIKFLVNVHFRTHSATMRFDEL